MKAAQIVGMILFIIFYGSYFRKSYSEKKNGISVGRIIRGVKPVRTKIIEFFLIFFTCAIATIEFLSIIYYKSWPLLLSGIKGGGSVAVFLLGTFISAAGIFFFLWAMHDMKENWRAGIDETQNTGLVTKGIYRFSRNPAFVGFDLFYIGFAIIFSNGLMILFTILAIFTLHMQIKEEEKFMEKRFGGSYLEYKKKTKRYLIFV